MPLPAEFYSPEQAKVTELPVDARALVDAPAGTGKTHALAGRLTRLVERDDLSAGDEVLVLSFSRAAVSELRARVSRLGGDAKYVGAATFDSFATQLLASQDAGGTWTTSGYDERMRAAVALLRGSKTPQLVALVRHVLIDEVQDLVGPRASLVMALLERHDGGFTLFGDPAQAIYAHQLDAGSDGPTNAQLYAWLTETFDTRLDRFTFTHDFRGRTEHADVIADIGRRLRDRHPDDSEIASRLRTLLLKLPTTTLGGARRLLVRGNGAASAVLCRTNAQALRISSELFERSIPHRYQRRGEDKAASGWLGRAVSGVNETRTTRGSLMPRLEQIADVKQTTAEELFAVLRSLAPARGDEVDLAVVANRLREVSFPEELNEVLAASVVVSTIHRAKGLEFDRVFVCEPPGERADEDPGEENRVIYVALSRARREIFHISGPDTSGLHVDRPSGRWIRTGFGANRWQVFEVEVFGPDSDPVHPAGTWLFDDDASELQRYLLDDVAPGDPVELVFAAATPHEGQVPHFTIQHRGRSIGVTSDRFGSDLTRLLGRISRPPRSLSGLHVEIVDTVAGDAASARRCGLGAHGIWTRARVFGLGVLEFDGGTERGE
jgi:AAA domain/UvrD-like helicase C-terminal domain